MASRGERPVHDVTGSEIAAHRVNGDPDHAGLVFVDCPDLARAVEHAFRADPVRWLRLVALGALAEADGLEGVVRAPLCGASFGMASFWIRHRCSRSRGQLTAVGFVTSRFSDP